jgi:hypothetical protein
MRQMMKLLQLECLLGCCVIFGLSLLGCGL